MPAIVDDGAGGVSFGANGRQYVLWGVETDQWQAAAGNTAHFDAYIEASKYINANCLAIHAPWRLIEPTKDVYDFSYLEYALKKTEEAGLKAVIYFTSANYAAGNMQFVPDYINDPVTYSRIQGDPTYFRTEPVAGQPALPACPSDPDLLEREMKAYGRLLKFLKEYDTNRNVLAIQVAGEADFLYAMKDEYWLFKNENVRCECADCNAAFEGFAGSNLDFMTHQFAVYIKKMVEAGAMVYDIPVYTCSSPLGYWKGEWRYAENSALRQEMVDFVDYFVGPTTAQTTDVQTYVTEMNNWTSDKMPGNHIWTSGIDTGHGTPGSPHENVGLDSWSHLEMAPWFNILHYKSLGAIYWDHPDVSVTLEGAGAPVREKLRAMWSPLRAASSVLPVYKSAPADKMMWWNYSEKTKSGTIGGYQISIIQYAGENYGFAFDMGNGDIVLSATTYNARTTTVSLTVNNSENLHFERGYFDNNGVWVKTGTFNATKVGNQLVFQISGDNGDYTKALYRIYTE